MTRSGVARALAGAAFVAAQVLPNPATAVPPFPNERSVTYYTPTGESLTVRVQWNRHYVGPAGGVPWAEWVCDAVFAGGTAAVALLTSVGCYFSASDYPITGLPMQMPGPLSVAGSTGRADGRICVQGLVTYLPVGTITQRHLSTPLACFDP